MMSMSVTTTDVDILKDAASFYGVSVNKLRELITTGNGPSLMAYYYKEKYPHGH